MINKTFHLIWLGDREPELPYLDKIKEMYPDWKIKIWKEEDFDFSIANSFVRKAIEMRKWFFVTDYYRMKIIYEEGGVYLDTDMDPVKQFPFDKYDEDLILGYEYRNNITMGFLAAKPGNKFIKEVIDYYDYIMDCNFFPLGNLVWTEMLYKTYPDLGVSNKFKEREGLVLFDRNAFGLWQPNRKESFFIHRHDIGWIDSKFIQNLIHFFAKFAKLTPAFIENIMVSHQRKMTRKRSKELLDRYVETIFVKEGKLYLDKELFRKINSNYNKKIIVLSNRNKHLERQLKQLDKVVRVEQFGNDISKQVDKTMLFEFKVPKRRAQIETFNNLVNKELNKK